MSVTDELREVARTHTTPELYTVVEADTLFDIANHIDEEHKRALTEQFDMFTVGMKPMTEENMAEGGWVRLPVDADGEYIHIGDVMDGTCPSGKHVSGTVKAIGDGVFWLVNVQFPLRPDYMHHHHKPTVEDVLREFGDEVQRCCDTKDTIAEYAERIREAVRDA